ncbi:MAG: plasmid partitioning protein RepB [Pseudomonadota bacterium]
MARKDVLKKLMQGAAGDPAPSAAGDASAAADDQGRAAAAGDQGRAAAAGNQGRAAAAAKQDRAADPVDGAARAKTAKGAVGAVGRSLAELKSRAIADLDPFSIEAGGMQDRLETVDAEDAMLRESIREHGQQVPVLVRPHPAKEGRYQIVYGRRRVLAMRDLGQPVKALIRDLDDRALVIAQGQENTARRDLSFIEKANFARQLSDAGYDRKVIGDALQIDKTLISRMLSTAERLPLSLLHRIGAAPGVGRDRWARLADLLDAVDFDEREAGMFCTGDTSDARFAALVEAMEGVLSGRAARAAAIAAAEAAEAGEPALPATSATTRRTVLRDVDGRRLGEARAGPQKTTLVLTAEPGASGPSGPAETAAFARWLVDRIPEIHRAWSQERGETSEASALAEDPDEGADEQ